MADGAYRCYVGGLSYATDDEALSEAFNKFEVTFCKVIRDFYTGRSKGFGFIAFANEQSRRDAIEEMNGKDLDGRQISVSEVKPPRSGGVGGGHRAGGGGGGR
ncbi:hypothetical protein RND81_11G172000 [Saponaria officinalis]|uniref:RRM domain-containing protein n=1 Tax=Saponaria officinalis TaxID=3572 RepID=A0AAW1HP96_SAPOF